MSIKRILSEVQENLDKVLLDPTMNNPLWVSFITLHPADIGDFLSNLDYEQATVLFVNMSKELKFSVFTELSNTLKVHVLLHMDDSETSELFDTLSADQLTDLFDLFSDEELKRYLRLLHKRVRDQVISLLQFDPESAGGIMTTDVVTLMQDFTVEKSVKLLQRLSIDKSIHQQLFVINKDHQLVGYINLQDLVLQKPHERISTFMHKNELIARAQEDRESIAKQMIHYGLTIVPVVDDKLHFLGVIPSQTLVDVIIEEAGEDVTRMASMPTLKYPYFETPFFQLIYKRAYVLIGLFVAESISGPILRSFEGVMPYILVALLPVITSAGGNTGSQASAVVIQGLASGDISPESLLRLLRREFFISGAISILLGFVGLLHVFFVIGAPSIAYAIAFGIAVAIIVFISSMLGSIIPFVLRRLRIDPAISAGPFLATIMDIIGIVIYCYICMWVLAQFNVISR